MYYSMERNLPLRIFTKKEKFSVKHFFVKSKLILSKKMHHFTEFYDKIVRGWELRKNSHYFFGKNFVKVT